MTTLDPNENDVRLRNAVRRILEWHPKTYENTIGVSAHNGTITLTGTVDHYAGRLTVEQVAKTVTGVRAVDNNVEVRPKCLRTDAEITADVTLELQHRSATLAPIHAVAHGGHVTLTGNVTSAYERLDVERIMRHVQGIRGVSNFISVASRVVTRDAPHHMEQLLHRRNITSNARPTWSRSRAAKRLSRES